LGFSAGDATMSGALESPRDLRKMFDRIAPRYDRINRIMTAPRRPGVDVPSSQTERPLRGDAQTAALDDGRPAPFLHPT
jgi:hypothetical protein